MKDRLKLAWRCISLLTLVVVASPVHAGTGKELFDKQCASCHTIGGGDTGGPDLKGVASKRPADWLVRVIVEPDALTKGKDPVQAELVKKYGYEMPNLKIGRDDAQKIVAFLKEAEGAPAAAKPAGEEAKKEEVVPTKELVAFGKSLFVGEKHLSKGGAPCVACHAFRYPGISGGNFGNDLTDLYEGMGEQGMKGALKSLRFPAMRKIYEDKPLTDEEIKALIAFAKDASTQKPEPGGKSFPLMGLGLFAFFMGGITLYKRRTR